MAKNSKKKNPDKNASGRFVATEYDTSRGKITNKKVADDFAKFIASLDKKKNDARNV